MKYEFAKIKCKCGWVSPELNKEQREELGYPWYCDDCGKRVSSFVRYNIHERDEVEKWSKM